MVAGIGDLGPARVRARVRGAAAGGAQRPRVHIAASLVWSPALALPLSWTGATLAGCTAFGFARFIGRDWVQGRIPERVQGYDEALVTKGFRTVLVLRLTLFTFGPMQLMLGVSKVRLRPYVLGTALGLLPLVAAETLIGASLVEWLFERA